MDLPLRCRCGLLAGQLSSTERAGRALCYCRDCQAFARFLGRPGDILDEAGGTDIVATSPRFVAFTQGQEQLRCMSLGPKGLLRWYAVCCRTPVGNTPRDHRLSYVGLVHSCLAGTPAEIDAAFGPARVNINTTSARGKVRSTPLPLVAAILKIMRNVLGSRLSGKYRDNPFFEPGTGRPRIEPQVLTPAERNQLRDET